MLIKMPAHECIGLRMEPTDIIHNAVKAVSQEHYAGNLVPYELRMVSHGARVWSARFMLRVGDSHKEPARRSASGRRTNAATWEAHKLVMRELFKECPSVTIVSALATYRGKDDFERNHGETYWHNAGSRMRPATFGSL